MKSSSREGSLSLVLYALMSAGRGDVRSRK